MLAAVLALAAAGCGDSETTDTGAGQTGGQATLEATPTAAAAGRTGGEMTFGILFDPQNFDVYQSFDTTSVAVWGAWWEYLIRPTKDTKGFEGRLAESFEQSDDDRVYTFKLRQGVTFSNGDPLTTEDVLYSLNRAFSEKTSTIVVPEGQDRLHDGAGRTDDPGRVQGAVAVLPRSDRRPHGGHPAEEARRAAGLEGLPAEACRHRAVHVGDPRSRAARCASSATRTTGRRASRCSTP
jgi:ABC-type transport system substrate-binding protein